MAKSGKSAAASTVGRPASKSVGRAGAFRIGTARAAAKASATAIGRKKNAAELQKQTKSVIATRLPAAKPKAMKNLEMRQVGSYTVMRTSEGYHAGPTSSAGRPASFKTQSAAMAYATKHGKK